MPYKTVNKEMCTSLIPGPSQSFSVTHRKQKCTMYLFLVGGGGVSIN